MAAIACFSFFLDGTFSSFTLSSFHSFILSHLRLELDKKEPTTGLKCSLCLSKVKEATGGRGANVIMEAVGGDVFTQCLRRYVTVG